MNTHNSKKIGDGIAPEFEEKIALFIHVDASLLECKDCPYLMTCQKIQKEGCNGKLAFELRKTRS